MFLLPEPVLRMSQGLPLINKLTIGRVAGFSDNRPEFALDETPLSPS